MVRLLISDANGARLGLYTKDSALCVGGMDRDRDSLATVRNTVECTIVPFLPADANGVVWTLRKVQRNKSVWSVALRDEEAAEAAAWASAAALQTIPGVLVAPVKKLGNVVY